jgi:hypothetical protein
MRKVEAMTTKKPRFPLGMSLLVASMLALYPAMILKKAQQRTATVSVKVNGQAYPNGKNKPASTFSSAALTLTGSVQTDGKGELKLGDLAGNLQIGIANYTITSGQGEVNKKGKIEINANTSDVGKKLELILHGNTQGETVVFDSKESKLSPLYFLSLTGQVTVTMPATSMGTTESDHDHPHENVIVTVTQRNTVTETTTQIQDNTVTVTETNNQAVTETVTQTVTTPATNSTVTITETVTSTVANSTITVTETVANTTLTATQT